MVEIDIQETKDRHIIVHHDDFLNPSETNAGPAK